MLNCINSKVMMSIKITEASFDQAIYFLDPIKSKKNTLNRIISAIALTIIRAYNYICGDGIWHNNASARTLLVRYLTKLCVGTDGFVNTDKIKEKAAILREALVLRGYAGGLDRLLEAANNPEKRLADQMSSLEYLSKTELSKFIGKEVHLIARNDIDTLFGQLPSLNSVDLTDLDGKVFNYVWENVKDIADRIETLNLSQQAFATSTMISHLLPKLTNLKTLDLTGMRLDLAFLESIQRYCPKIDRVKIDLQGAISPAVLLHYNFTRPREF